MSMPSDPPWLAGLTIPHVLDRTIQKFADRDALVFPQLGLRLGYREFGQQVDRAARGLLALGVRSGEHVAIWATNLPQWVILQFATARIGSVLVTINPAYRAHELSYVLKQSDAVVLVLTDNFKSSDYFAMLAEVCPEVAVGADAAAGATAGLPSSGAAVLGLRSSTFPKLRHVVAIKGNAPAAAILWSQLLALGDAVP